jgi:uncharacterized membrane protein YhfC
MDILALFHLLNGILMVAMPVGLAICLTRYWKMGARLWWIGVATFILSQIVHIPVNIGVDRLLNQTSIISWDPIAQLLFYAIFLGLSAGIFEEGARYLVLRWWAKDARSWRNGVLFGAGHGGVEAIILGLLVIYAFFQMMILRNNAVAEIVPASQLALVQEQVASYWSTTWYNSLLGALERLFTIPCQIAMAVMVMQVFTRKNILWLLIAIGYHAILDGVAVFGQKYLGSLELEAVVGLFAVTSVAIIIFLRQPEPAEVVLPVLISPDLPIPGSIQETVENLENTRYQAP